VLIAAAVIVFAGSLSGVFVYDDDEAIVRNPHIRALSPIGEAFTAPPQSAVSGRPLVSLSLALNHAAGGLEPTGYHVVNVTLHALAALALYTVLVVALRGPRIPAAVRASSTGLALAVALLWLVHPLQSEVVDYTIQRTESMMGLAAFCTLAAGVRGMRAQARSTGWLALSVSACAAGAACKETIVVLPLLVWLYDVVFEAGSVAETWRRRRGYYAGLAATWLLLALVTWGQPRSGAGASSAVSWVTYLMAQGPMILTYLARVVWPWPLVVDYGRATALPVSAVVPGLLATSGLLALTLVWWRKDARVAYLGVWFFLTLAPTSSVIPIGTEIGAERRMYLPLAAVLALLVLGAWRLATRMRPTRRRLRAALTAGAAVVHAAVTMARHADYRDRLRLWQTVVDARPHGRARHNLGIELMARGRRDEALAQYRLAVADAPEAHYALGFALVESGQPGEAATHFRQFLEARPDDALAPRAATLLGVALAEQGDHAGAIDAFHRTLGMQPQDADAQSGLADALRESGRLDDAAAAYRALLDLQPQNAQAWSNLGAVLALRQRPADAVIAFARAVELAPESAPARLNHGLGLMEAGRTTEAIAAFRRGLALDPKLAAVSNALAAALATTGDRAGAVAQFKHTLDVEPDNAGAIAGLRTLGVAAGQTR
jgi:Flp pilus assembly protein TadD